MPKLTLLKLRVRMFLLALNKHMASFLVILQLRPSTKTKMKGEIIMKKNVGKVDKWIRIILGIALLCLIFIIEGNLRWLGLIGLIPLITGLINYCPLYELLGISTTGKK